MLWCTELDTAENFGLTSIQKPLIAKSKCPLLNIHPVCIYVTLKKGCIIVPCLKFLVLNKNDIKNEIMKAFLSFC